MELEEQWEKAVESTQVLMSRVLYLAPSKMTWIPYIFLAESLVNAGDTVVRRGKVNMHKPAIILPENMPFFEGFEFEEGLKASDEALRTFFMIRGISFPSMRFKNQTSNVDVFEGSLEKAKAHFRDELEKEEDTQTGLVAGHAEGWQFSIMIYAAMLAAKSADSDIRWFEEKFRKWFA